MRKIPSTIETPVVDGTWWPAPSTRPAARKRELSYSETADFQWSYLFHGELFENGVVLVQPEPAKPVQDAILLRSAGLGVAQGLRLGLRAVLGGCWVLLPTGLAAHVWVEVMLGGRV